MLLSVVLTGSLMVRGVMRAGEEAEVMVRLRDSFGNTLPADACLRGEVRVSLEVTANAEEAAALGGQDTLQVPLQV